MNDPSVSTGARGRPRPKTYTAEEIEKIVAARIQEREDLEGRIRHWIETGVGPLATTVSELATDVKTNTKEIESFRLTLEPNTVLLLEKLGVVTTSSKERRLLMEIVAERAAQEITGKKKREDRNTILFIVAIANTITALGMLWLAFHGVAHPLP